MRDLKDEAILMKLTQNVKFFQGVIEKKGVEVHRNLCQNIDYVFLKKGETVFELGKNIQSIKSITIIFQSRFNWQNFLYYSDWSCECFNQKERRRRRARITKGELTKSRRIAPRSCVWRTGHYGYYSKTKECDNHL